MEIAIGVTFLVACVAAWKLKVMGVPVVKERLAHWLMASAAGDRARQAAFAAAMKQTVRLEAE